MNKIVNHRNAVTAQETRMQLGFDTIDPKLDFVVTVDTLVRLSTAVIKVISFFLGKAVTFSKYTMTPHELSVDPSRRVEVDSYFD